MFLNNITYKNDSGKTKCCNLICNIIGSIQCSVDQGTAVFLKITFQYIKQGRVKWFGYNSFLWQDNTDVFVGDHFWGLWGNRDTA